MANGSAVPLSLRFGVGAIRKLRNRAGLDAPRVLDLLLATLRSPTRNHVPVTVATFELAPGASIEQNAPFSHNGFFYPIAGRARIGGRELTVGDIGWLDRPPEGATGDAVIRIENPGSEPLVVVHYAGARQNIPIVTYGPFVGDTREDIVRAMRSYQAGTFVEV